MKTVKKIGVMVLVSFVLFACSQSSDNKAYQEEVSMEGTETLDESAVYEVVEESASLTLDKNLSDEEQLEQKTSTTEKEAEINTNKDYTSIVSSGSAISEFENKKFIKTANINFLVKDVYKSTIAIEEIILAQNGFLVNSNLYTEVLRAENYEKNDSFRVEIEEYKTINNITFKVPSANLHATLMALGQQIEFLDQRNITVDDVSLQLLAEELEQKRNAKSAAKLDNSVQQGGNLGDKVYAEEVSFEKATQKDLSYLKELSIQDEINFSSITLSIYQNPEVSVNEVLNFDVYQAAYKSSFLQELGNAFSASFVIIKEVVLGLFTIWPILLVLVGVIYGYKKRMKK